MSIVNDMQAVGYIRVSTERQADQGVCLEAQEAKVRAMATVLGAELLEVIVDGGVRQKPGPSWTSTASLAGERR